MMRADRRLFALTLLLACVKISPGSDETSQKHISEEFEQEESFVEEELIEQVVIKDDVASSTEYFTTIETTAKDLAEAESDSLESRQYPRNRCNCYYQGSCGCVCTQPITWEEFQALPQNFRSCPSFTLQLRGGNFHSFPSDYFFRIGNILDFVLDVSGITFQYLLDPGGQRSPFNGVSFDTSAFIRAHQVTITRSWNWAHLYDLRPTRRLAYCEVQVAESTLPVLTSDFGRICQGYVTAVSVTNSNMNSLDDRVFQPFFKLNDVNLSYNRLRVMMRSQFPNPANELQKINLSYNQISSLPNDMFRNMPSLNSVDLQGNPISTLTYSTYSPIFQRTDIIGLENMPLHCDCNLRWLKEPMNLCGNNMYRLAATICQTPSRLRGSSFFNDTLPKDLVC